MTSSFATCLDSCHSILIDSFASFPIKDEYGKKEEGNATRIDSSIYYDALTDAHDRIITTYKRYEMSLGIRKETDVHYDT